MTAVLAHTHYLPITWRGLAHTTRVREQFGQFFQFRFTHLMNELLSPLITPYVLMFYFRPRSLDLVDFFRNFTVAVVGVGDVCSFAQMDVRKHGNPDWQPAHSTTDAVPDHVTPVCETNQYTQGEHGKTELSLMHFTLTNPGWKMPSDAQQFVHGIRRHAIHDLDAQRPAGDAGAAAPATAMEQSLYLVSSMGGEYASIVQSAINTQRMFGADAVGGQMQTSSQCSYGLRNPFAGASATSTGGDGQQQQMNAPQRPTASYDFQHMLNQNMSMEGDVLAGPHRSTLLDSIQENTEDPSVGGGGGVGANTASTTSSHMGTSSVIRTTGLRTPLAFNQSVLGASMGASTVGGLSRREGPPDGSQEGLLHSVFGQADADGAAHPTEVTATDMCLSTLYLHELHHRQIRRRGGPADQRCRQQWQRPHQSQAGGGAPQSQSQSTSPASFGSPSTSAAGQLQMGALSGAAAVENTPLLSGAKKS